MRKLPAAFVCIFLASCGATQAEQQVASVNTAGMAATQQAESCYGAIAQEMQLSRLATHIDLQQRVPSFDQKADTSFPTLDEVQQLKYWHGRITPCQQDFLATSQSNFPMVYEAFAKTFNQMDATLLLLAQRRISYGEANTQFDVAITNGKELANQSIGNWSAQMAAENQQQHADRSAAWNAVGDIVAGVATAAAEGAVEGLENRGDINTVTTTCRSWSDGSSCTTRY